MKETLPGLMSSRLVTEADKPAAFASPRKMRSEKVGEKSVMSPETSNATDSVKRVCIGGGGMLGIGDGEGSCEMGVGLDGNGNARCGSSGGGAERVEKGGGYCGTVWIDSRGPDTGSGKAGRARRGACAFASPANTST